jgi:hypothetical protein
MQYFNVDLSTLLEGESKNMLGIFDNKSVRIHVARGVRGPHFPSGSSFISAPLETLSDGYWYAAAFPIVQSPTASGVDRWMLLECVAGLLEDLEECKMTASDVSLDSFLARMGRYRLDTTNCQWHHDVSGVKMMELRKKLLNLFPRDERHKHALSEVSDMRRLKKHPVFWTVYEDLAFLTLFITMESNTKFSDLDEYVLEGNWARAPAVKRDVDYVNSQGIGIAQYNPSSFVDLCRYIRNKGIHINQLNGGLKRILGGSLENLFTFANTLVQDNDLVFMLWKKVNLNKDVQSMDYYWIKCDCQRSDC